MTEKELKTLKDWEIEQDEEDGVVDIIWLKAEAIKWVKGFEKETNFNGRTDFGGEISSWIIAFFNLTKEDLQ